MATLRRRIADLIGRLSGNLIVPVHEAHELPATLHLGRLFARFEVDCVFDVGANRGQYARWLRRKIGFRGPVISFEPIPELAEALRREAEGDPLWHVEALALDREAGPAAFHVTENSEFSSLRRPAADQPAMFETMNHVAQVVHVMRETLGSALARWRERLGFSRPFLKLDTQGSDLGIARGAGAALTAFVGVQSELAIRPLYEGAPGFAEALAEYRRLGFELSAIVPNNAGHFPVLIETDCVMLRRDLIDPAQLPRGGAA